MLWHFPVAENLAWWAAARTLEQRVQRLLDSLEPLASNAQLPVLAEVLDTLGQQRALLRCGIDSILRQKGATRVTPPVRPH